MARVLLVSSSMSNRGLLTHAEDALREAIADAREVAFVPYALSGWDAYEAHVGQRLKTLFGVTLRSIHHYQDPASMICDSEVIFTGGGNTFVLLRELQERGLLDVIRNCVQNGTSYIGSSAGANIAGPAIYTTNDMPIVCVESFDALGLVPFLINPHYFNEAQDPGLGEARDERIHQYHEYGDLPVLAIYGDSLLQIVHERTELRGGKGARVFRRGRDPVDVASGDDLAELFSTSRDVRE